MRRSAVRIRCYTAECAAAVRADVLIYFAALVYLVVGAAYVLAMSRPLFGRYDVYSSGCLVLCCLVLPYFVALIGLLRIAFFAGRRRALAYRHFIAPRRIGRLLAGTLLMLVMLMLFEAMYTSVKTAFSSSGFAWDRRAADLDQSLHFGVSPDQWLSGLRNDWILRIVEFNYDFIWVGLWIGMLYWVSTSRRADGIRHRFMLTFMLVWAVVGNAVAGVFSSAGPAFYGLVTGDTGRFSHLQSFLDGTPSMTALSQHYLWSLYQSGQSGLASGISAFPSMHVAVTATCALFLFERDTRLGWAAAIYTVVIIGSSVYLGWHYAIDGYAAVLLVLAIYWLVRAGEPALGRLAQWRPLTRRPVLASGGTELGPITVQTAS
jgi:membrane-associated phospholipid phosphatase